MENNLDTSKNDVVNADSKKKRKLTKKQKIVISLVVVIVLIFAGIMLYNASKPILKLSNEKTSYGSEGYFTVSAENFKKDTSAFDISLSFDNSSIEVLEISKGTIDGEVAVSKESYANSKGEIKAVYIDYTGGDSPIDLSGDILYVRYKVKQPKSSKLTFGDINIVNPSGDIKGFIARKDGSIEVK